MSNSPSHLLLIDDDPVFCNAFRRSLARRGIEVEVAHDVQEAECRAQTRPPRYATLDLRMPGSCGLTLIERLRALNPEVRIVVLTGYASIATAVEAIKLGAIQYLTKPTDAAQILDALHQDEGNPQVEIPEQPLSVSRLEWEHIHKVLADCDGNISAAARALGMHRRTLQRKLAKHPARR
ncbi:MAG: response regulator transcription factor [Chromatiaceae bacterium]|jgi:two-component system response regulator RegA